MQWQDLVLTVGQTIATVSLLPSVFSKDKPAFLTSVMTSVLLFIFAITYISLSLYFTSISITVTGVLWAVLAYQKYNKRKGNK